MRETVSLEQPGIALVHDLEALVAHASEVAVATDSPPAERVHETRKLLKRARAYLQMLPPALRRVPYERLRAIQKALGTMRDVTAAAEAIDRLCKRDHASKSVQRALERVRRAAQSTDEDAAVPVLIEASDALSELARDIPMNTVADFSAIAKGLRRVAKRSRRAMRKAQRSLAAEDFHAWRRVIKYHALCLRYITTLHAELLEREQSIADDVARTLGEEHDIELVRAMASRVPLQDTTRVELEAFLDEAQTHSRHIALDLGIRIHAERPRAFADRIEAYFDARVALARDA